MVLIMTMMTMAAVFGVIAGIVTIFHNRVEDEKAELNSKLVQQMLFHFELLTDEMEYDLFERVLSEGVPGMMLMKADDARRFNLHSKLSAISRHNDYTTELFVVDNADEIFSSSVDETLLVHIDELIKEGFFTSKKGSSWLRDDEGNVFFRRNLNNIYPYESAGELIALVDQNAFWSAMGLNVTKATQLIFYDNDGKPILFSDEHVMTSDNLSGYIIFSSGKEDEWHVRSFVKRSEALDTVDNSQINVLSQRTMHRICTAATNEEVSFAYRVAIPRQRFRWRNAFSTRWRSL
jgi:hypothetical protein